MLQSILNYIKGLINIFYDVRLTPPWYMHTHLKYKSVAGIGGNSQQRRTARRALVSRTVKNISWKIIHLRNGILSLIQHWLRSELEPRREPLSSQEHRLPVKMGKVKAYLEHALSVLQVSHEEVEGMSISEIDTLLKNHEHSLKEAVDEIKEQVKQVEPCLTKVRS